MQLKDRMKHYKMEFAGGAEQDFRAIDDEQATIRATSFLNKSRLVRLLCRKKSGTYRVVLENDLANIKNYWSE